MLVIALQDTDDALLGHDFVHHYKFVEDLLYAKSEQGEDIQRLIFKSCFFESSSK